MRIAKMILLAGCILLGACDGELTTAPDAPGPAVIANQAIDEASGLQASSNQPDTWFVHNDDGTAMLFAMDTDGRELGSFTLDGAANRDWEDITRVTQGTESLLVVADSGDNFAQWDQVTLYFAPEPEPDEDGRYSGHVAVRHSIQLHYPDGPRDCEAVASDPSSGRILFLTKRDVPPRLYGIDLDTALTASSAQLEFLGEAVRFRGPTAEDMRHFGARDGRWVSQPTGMDIDADGRRAAVISYRSLYLFERAEGESWAQAFARDPVEFEGPPSRKEESVGFSGNGQFVLVTTEGVPAPLYRMPLEQPAR